MRKRMSFVWICLLTSAILVACGPSQAELDAQATEVAANIFATQTAEAPTPTFTPTSTPTPTFTPTQTPTPTKTPTPTFTPTSTPTPTFTPTPTATPLPRRLDNGEYINRVDWFHGEGELEIDNGTSLDAVAVLTTLTEEPLASVYVRASSQFTITDIPDGEYKLFFMLGEDWDDATGRFTRKAHYSAFQDTFSYITTSTTATIWKATLHPVVGGTAATEEVDPSKFPPVK